jgi:drug/metabolite transporter (DMT)-like permease
MAARLAALAAVVMWGVSFVATKLALGELSPIAVIVLRFGLGVIVAHVILVLRRRPIVPPRDALPALAFMGFIGVFVHQLIQANALTMTTAVRTGWLIGITPIWTAVLAAVFLKEKFGPSKVFGLIVATAGALLVISRGQLSATSYQLPATRGDLLILLSTVNWAVYTVAGRGTLKRVGSERTTAASMLLGFLMLAPFSVTDPVWRNLGGISMGGWAAVIFLGVGCSALGYLFWYAALEKLETAQVAAFLYIEPLVTLIAAVILIGETVDWTTVVGGVLVLLGVTVVQRTAELRNRGGR